MRQFSAGEASFVLAMKLIVVLYDNLITKVLLADRGFDAVLLKEILSGSCTSEEAQDFALRVINEVPANERMAKLWKAIKEKADSKGKASIQSFSTDIFDAKFIMTKITRHAILSQIDSSVAKYLDRLNTSEEDCLFDYTDFDAQHQEDAAFAKVGKICLSRRLLPRSAVDEAGLLPQGCRPPSSEPRSAGGPQER
jgi:hypothetical protein